MKRTFALIFAGLAAAALFGGLVHVVLVAAHVSEPAAITVYGPTSQRLWATTSALLALGGVVIGGLALARAAGRIGPGKGRNGAIVALVAGPIAAITGGLLLAIADGGPGTGNGVVGAAAAVVLGLIAIAEGGLVDHRGTSYYCLDVDRHSRRRVGSGPIPSHRLTRAYFDAMPNKESHLDENDTTELLDNSSAAPRNGRCLLSDLARTILECFGQMGWLNLGFAG
ncbi:MAG: DUF6223 family protein [Chloroflexi bacterium]|nr:DUF6223 family protein [Chloroflexota bacterium]